MVAHGSVRSGRRSHHARKVRPVSNLTGCGINTRMKVVQLEFYRIKKEIELLEKKINALASARDLKASFKEWLKHKSGSQQ